MKILLIGAGEIAQEYVKTLLAMGISEIHILSRTEASAIKLCDKYSLEKAYGGGDETLDTIIDKFDAFIIATPIESLLPYLKKLTIAGKEKVLVEKPVSLSSYELNKFIAEFPKCSADVALNRLYFPSVQEMKKISEQQIITSVEFSFTEWIHRIDTEKFSDVELQRWGISNCIHVIATVFNIAGLPDKISTYVSNRNKIDWHSSGTVFTGAGITQAGIPFSYNSDWSSAGRWSITIRTTSGSYHFSPMEGMNYCPKGSITIENIVPVWESDIKCGFQPMLKAWLEGDKRSLVSIAELKKYIDVIETIFKYEE